MDSRLRRWRQGAKKLRELDRKLAPIIDHVGPPAVTFVADPFEALAVSILSQQLAPRAADTIVSRVRALSPPFPRPSVILRLPRACLSAAGVSPQKLGYLLALSQAWSRRAWRAGWETLGNEALVSRLTEVKGVGEWTAQMFLIFGLGRPDVLATGDYGIRRGLGLLHGMKNTPLPKEIPILAHEWRGVESIGSWYVWQGLDRKLIK